MGRGGRAYDVTLIWPTRKLVMEYLFNGHPTRCINFVLSGYFDGGRAHSTYSAKYSTVNGRACQPYFALPCRALQQETSVESPILLSGLPSTMCLREDGPLG